MIEKKLNFEFLDFYYRTFNKLQERTLIAVGFFQINIRIDDKIPIPGTWML